MLNLQRRAKSMSLIVTGIVGGIIVGAALLSHRTAAAAEDENEGPSASVPPGAQQEIRQVEARIDRYESSYLEQFRATPPDQADALTNNTRLGGLLLYDKHLSVRSNEACAFCHMPETGFTGSVSAINQTNAAYPGSVRSRSGNRKPQSYAYAPFAPVFHYDHTQQNFYGGNFWDGRATGTRLGNPAAEQAQGPPDNPAEMGFTDFACFVFRAARRPYSTLATAVWGAQIFDINWPADTEAVCSKPGTGPNPSQPTLQLTALDRGKAQAAYDELTQSIAQYETHPPVSRFSSKFDYFLSGDNRAQLTSDEMQGWQLFRTKGNCNSCHLDGTQNNGPTPHPGSLKHLTSRANGTEPVAASYESLFTDFTFANLGVPQNPKLPFLHENKPDRYGFVANPAGEQYHDGGMGAFLQGKGGSPNPSQEWAQYGEQYEGTFQTPTLRDVDLRPGLPSHKFVKAYMHNGYFKSLKEVVHFYNTRDKYQVGQGQTCEDKHVNVDCFPAPDIGENLDTSIGDLQLSDKEEDQIVEFLETLTDGYNPATGSVEVSQPPR